MDIREATRQYEQWLSTYTPLVPADLNTKHQQMQEEVFAFLRATYYRWAQVWSGTCNDLANAPSLLAVGDLHIANFGTWRDREGRLCWGVNDFDVASLLPYTHDLIRLATSALLAIQSDNLHLKPENACAAILTGYTEGMNSSGKAFVLAEQHGWLRDIAVNNLKKPQSFWQKMDALPDITEPLPESVRVALEYAMPALEMNYQVKHRTAGLGSLGLPRYVAIGEFEDGRVAREAKAMVPSAVAWAVPPDEPVEYFYEAILAQAVRAHDPFTQVQGNWILRRLAPDCIRVEITTLPDVNAEGKLLNAMGKETANIHLGSRQAVAAVRRDLNNRGAAWLLKAASAMTNVVHKDWQDWKAGR